jgi:signal recognition particle subunit SRP54
MLETVSKGFKSARNRLKGYRELSADNIEDALRDIRISLLEADVEFNVVKAFLNRVQEKAVGEIVQVKTKGKDQNAQVSPGDHFVKICLEELTDLMGPVDTSIQYRKGGVSRIMVVGLQGSGKTTTIAKLARLIEKEGKRPMLVAADVYRPAAIDQLKVLGQRLRIPVYDEGAGDPVAICRNAVERAKAIGRNVVLFDTAGRLAIDEPLMAELDQIVGETQPDNIFLVCDAMIGQDAVKTAATFNERLNLDGVLLTKLDGDARGGAALSIKAVTGKPIKFVGMGEGIDKLEPFRPDGIASRILGLGDVVGLMQDFEEVVDEEKAEEDAKKILSGDFNLVQFLDQIKTIQKLGPIKEVFEKLPLGDMPQGMNLDDKQLKRVEAIISSMTPKEREQPKIIDDSRIARIANGSGTQRKDVKELIQRFDSMRKLMGQVGKNPGLLSRIPGFKQLAQLKDIQGLDMGDAFGPDMGGGGPPMPGMPMGMPGMPGMPASAARRPVSSSKKNKMKNRKKMAKKSRQKKHK